MDKIKLFFVITILYSSVSFAGNGCGTGWNKKWVRDSYGGANFTYACNNHDSCYETCGASQRSCDKKFRSEMKDECRSTFRKSYETLVKKACLKIADGYYEGVKQLGSDAFNEAQKEASCSSL